MRWRWPHCTILKQKHNGSSLPTAKNGATAGRILGPCDLRVETKGAKKRGAGGYCDVVVSFWAQQNTVTTSNSNRPRNSNNNNNNKKKKKEKKKKKKNSKREIPISLMNDALIISTLIAEEETSSALQITLPIGLNKTAFV